jgi:hypothetical protein
MNRQELDARNSEQRKPNFYELAANKFNDHGFNPQSLILPDLHEDFKDPLDLSTATALVPTPVTAAFIKQKFGRAKLSLTTVRCMML